MLKLINNKKIKSYLFFKLHIKHLLIHNKDKNIKDMVKTMLNIISDKLPVLILILDSKSFIIL